MLWMFNVEIILSLLLIPDHLGNGTQIMQVRVCRPLLPALPSTDQTSGCHGHSVIIWLASFRNRLWAFDLANLHCNMLRMKIVRLFVFWASTDRQLVADIGR